MEDAELLTDWQRRNAEFKERRKIGGAEDAKAKLARLKAFQQRLRSGDAAGSAAPAAADAAGHTGEVGCLRAWQPGLGSLRRSLAPLLYCLARPGAQQLLRGPQQL